MRTWLVLALAVAWSNGGGAAEVAPTSPTAAAAARGAEIYEQAIADAEARLRRICGARSDRDNIDACLRLRQEARSRARAGTKVPPD